MQWNQYPNCRACAYFPVQSSLDDTTAEPCPPIGLFTFGKMIDLPHRAINEQTDEQIITNIPRRRSHNTV